MPDGEILGKGATIVPRSVVTVVALGVLLFVGLDIGAQFVVPGHTANPLIDAPLVALLASILVGKAGPKPEAPEPEQPADTEPPTSASGRHRGGDAS